MDKYIDKNAWIVIAAYNEASVIYKVISEIKEYWCNVVVVDDGSTDNTKIEAARAGAIVVSHLVNLGQGAALATGIEFCLDMNADYIVTYDADGQHCVGDIEKIINKISLEKIDVVIGSRFLGKTINMPCKRRLLLKMAVLFTRLTTGLLVTDAHNGFRCFSKHAAQQIRIRQNRMAHASEILEEIASNKLSYAEMPVTIIYTAYSLSKGQKLSNAFSIMIDLFLGQIKK